MNTKIKELEAQLDTTTERGKRVDLLNALAWELRVSDPRRAITLGEGALELATQEDTGGEFYQRGIAESLRTLGRLHSHLGDYITAISLLLEALSRYEILGDLLGKVLSLNGLGVTCLFLGDYPDALKYFLEALENFAAVGDKNWQAGLLNNIGYLNLEMDRPAEALGYLTQSLDVSRQTDNKNLQGDALDNCCHAYCRLGDFENAVESGLESVRIYRDAGARQGEAEALNSVGDVYFAQGDNAQALVYFNQALERSQEVGLKFEFVESLLRIGKLHLRQEQSDQALTCIQKALSVAQEIKARHEIYACHEALAQAYKQTGKFDKALAHFERFHAAKERVSNEDTDRRLQSLEAYRRTEVKQAKYEIHQLKTIALRQEIAERLQREIAAREALIADLNAFAHMVAHDLKNPVTAITGYGSLLAHKLASTQDIELLRYVEIIEQTGYRMSRIIDELLLLTSVRQQEIAPQPIDMYAVINEVEGRLAYMIEETKTTITKPTNWPTAMGYAPWVEEVWANYISNAIKYGGVPPHIQVGGDHLNGGAVRFWVRDNGDGINPRDQTNLFTPFTRLDQVRATGHGLGLSIVKRIVEKLSGSVSVQSQGVPGQGCTFSFTLPAAQSPEQTEPDLD